MCTPKRIIIFINSYRLYMAFIFLCLVKFKMWKSILPRLFLKVLRLRKRLKEFYYIMRYSVKKKRESKLYINCTKKFYNITGNHQICLIFTQYLRWLYDIFDTWSLVSTQS